MILQNAEQIKEEQEDDDDDVLRVLRLSRQ
jgi:hypothetical protein